MSDPVPVANNYFPTRWYWIVGNDQTHVYNSATGQFVPLDNADYEAWLKINHYPSRIASKTELRDVFVAQSSDALAKFDANQTLP